MAINKTFNTHQVSHKTEDRKDIHPSSHHIPLKYRGCDYSICQKMPEVLPQQVSGKFRGVMMAIALPYVPRTQLRTYPLMYRGCALGY